MTPKKQQQQASAAKEESAASATAASVAAPRHSVFDAAPAELEVGMGLAFAGLAVSPASSPSNPSTPLPPPPPRSPPSQQQHPPQDAAAASIPSRLLSSLPSYLLPAFLVGGARGSTFKPLKQHTVGFIFLRFEI